jgi:hypothetical protein
MWSNLQFFEGFAVSVQKNYAEQIPQTRNSFSFSLQVSLHPRSQPPYMQFCWPNRAKYGGTCNPVNAL